MVIPESDTQLLEKARQGDAQAFGDLYERYLDDLYRYIYYRTALETDAEDLTERVFLKVWQNIDTYRGEVPFAAWLYRIAANTVVDHYRTRREHQPLATEADLRDQEPLPEQRLIHSENGYALAEAVAALPSEYQQVLILRFVNGYSAQESGEVMERSAGAIRVLQHRALQALRTQLQIEEITNGE